MAFLFKWLTIIGLLNGSIDRFLFILGIMGLKRISEENCLSFLSASNFDIDKLIYQLERTYETLREKGRMNEKREKLYKEILEWFSSQK